MPARNFSRSKVLHLLCGLAFVLLLAACSSVPKTAHLADPYVLLDSDADLYIRIDAAQNRQFLDTLVTFFVPEASQKDKDRLLSYMETIFLSYNRNTGNVQVVSQGQFPVQYAGLIFTGKNGWHKEKSCYIHQNGLQVAFVARDLALFGLNLKNDSSDIVPEMVADYSKRIFMPVEADLLLTQKNDSAENGIPVPSAAEWFAGKTTSDGNICSVNVFFRNYEAFAFEILDSAITFGIDAVAADLIMQDSNDFETSVCVFLKDKRVAKAAAMIFKIICAGLGINADISASGNQIFLRNFDLKQEEVIQMIGSTIGGASFQIVDVN